MVDRATVSKLGSWSGYRVGRVAWPEQSGGTVEIHLRPMRKGLTCKRCGRRSQQVHETVPRRVRDLPLFEYRVVLVVPRRRLWCDHYGGPSLATLVRPGHGQRHRVSTALCPAPETLSARHLTHCRHPLHTSVLEGINYTIKVIKRRAYGYRDTDYFCLKIRAAFPGIPR